MSFAVHFIGWVSGRWIAWEFYPISGQKCTPKLLAIGMARSYHLSNHLQGTKVSLALGSKAGRSYCLDAPTTAPFPAHQFMISGASGFTLSLRTASVRAVRRLQLPVPEPGLAQTSHRTVMPIIAGRR